MLEVVTVVDCFKLMIPCEYLIRPSFLNGLEEFSLDIRDDIGVNRKNIYSTLKVPPGNKRGSCPGNVVITASLG